MKWPGRLFIVPELLYARGGMTDLHYDLCVIGGGINGAGIARDAAGRGLSVLLIEAQDIAGATSSASSKLIHGGLRYLENLQIKMVGEALKEREVLCRTAPHLVRPMEFVLPHDTAQRPFWMIRAGLFLYDFLALGKSLPSSRTQDLSKGDYGMPLREEFTRGFVYSDCWADDTRLVVLNVVDAAERGAEILTRTACIGLEEEEGRWRVFLRKEKGEESEVTASMVVNATGPWAVKFLEQAGLADSDPDLPKMRLVKGSHLIVPRQYKGDHAYILQQPDGRVVFVTPYEDRFSLIGTTEEAYDADPREAMISKAETEYLCAAYNRSFKAAISPSDAIFTFSGVRPLFDDGKQSSSKVTRDYRIYHHNRYAPPLLSVFGGKLTTYRALSQTVVNKLMLLSGRQAIGWTAKKPLAGGDIKDHDFHSFMFLQRELYPWMPLPLLYRYARAYGTRVEKLLDGLEDLAGLGEHYGDDIFAVEIAYLRRHEWAKTVEDILWRRSKLGLHAGDETIRRLETLFESDEPTVEDRADTKPEQQENPSSEVRPEMDVAKVS